MFNHIVTNKSAIITSETNLNTAVGLLDTHLTAL